MTIVVLHVIQHFVFGLSVSACSWTR